MRLSWPGLTLTLALATLVAACKTDDEPDGGIIIPNCTKTAECSGGLVCIEGSCKLSMSVPQNGACTATRDCTTGLYCEPTASRCQPAGTGLTNAACSSDGNCTQGLRCVSTGAAGVCSATGTEDYGNSCTTSNDCLAGLYCGGDHTCQPFKTAFIPSNTLNCLPETRAFRSYFEVPRTGFPKDFFRLPYPNDIRVQTTSPRLNVDDFPRAGVGFLGIDVVDTYLDTMAEDFDGFSPVGGVLFRFSADLDVGFFNSHLLGGATIVDLTTGEPLPGVGYVYGTGRTRFSCENMLNIVVPASIAPLVPGHTYATILTKSALRAQSGGAAPVQDDDLVAVLGASRPSDAALGKAWDDYAKLRAWLPSSGIAVADVANAAVYTVADPTATMKKLAAATLAVPPPVLSSLFQCGSGGTDPCDDGSESRRCGAADPDFVEIHGKIKLPIFQSGTAPYLRPSDGGAINLVGGNPTKVRDEEVCFALTLPTGTAPAAGWPLMVYGHGTGGSFRSFISTGLAKRMAGATPKVAMFAIDEVGHGARRGSSMATPDQLVFNLANPRAARDNWLQGAADVITALRLPSATISGAWTGPTIKFPAKVVYFGHSQGATHGALALPFTDDAGAAVQSGAGANLTISLLNKTSQLNVADALKFLLLEPVTGNHPMMLMWQQFFDRADPANYNGLIFRAPPAGRVAKHVLMTWGTGDTYTPTDTLVWNALTLGVQAGTTMSEGGNPADYGAVPTRPISKNIGGTITGVFIQGMKGSGDGHFVAWQNSSVFNDWVAFVTSYFGSGTPIVP